MTEILFDCVLPVHVDNEFLYVVDAAHIRLSKDDIVRILQLGAIAKREGIDEVRVNSELPVWGFLGEDDEGFRAAKPGIEGGFGEQFTDVEHVQLVVAGVGEMWDVQLSANLRHSSVRLWTEDVSLEELRELLPDEASAANRDLRTKDALGRRVMPFEQTAAKDAFVLGVEFVNDSAVRIVETRQLADGSWHVIVEDDDG